MGTPTTATRPNWRLPRHTGRPSGRHGGETEFIEKLLGPGVGPEALQPLANCGRDVLVFHNEYRILPIAMTEPRTANCAAAKAETAEGSDG